MTIDLYLDLASLIIGCMIFRRSWPFAYRCLFLLNTLKVLVSFFSFFWSPVTHTSNHWVSNLFLPIQCAGFLLVFYKAAVHPRVVRTVGWLLAALPLLILLCWIRGASLYSINIWAWIGYDFLLLLAACLTFVDLLLRTDNTFFLRQPLFWLASGIFFYSVETIIVGASWEYTMKMIMYTFFKIIYYSSDYLMDVGIIGCFICLYLERKTRTPGQNPDNLSEI
jgi:hypothetical protein